MEKRINIMDHNQNKKILVLASDFGNDMALKLVYVLQRTNVVKVGVIGGDSTIVGNVDGTVVSEEIKSLLRRGGVDLVITTSEIFQKEGRENETRLELLRDVYGICEYHKIRLIHISIKYAFVRENDVLKLIGTKSSEEYSQYRELVIEILEKISTPLSMWYVDVVYGNNFYCDTVDIVKHISKGGGLSLSQVERKFEVYPVLNDEVAKLVYEHMSDGSFCKAIKTEYGYTFELWVRKIKEVIDSVGYDLKKDSEYRQNSNGLSEVEVGTKKALRQERCAFQFVYRMDPLERFCGKRVAEIRYNLGRRLAVGVKEIVGETIDCVVPVPQTGCYYAMGVADGMSVPYIQALIKDDTKARSFQLSNSDERKLLIRKNIRLMEELVNGKNILLVDEAVFTGVTMKMICGLLRKTNVKKIFIGIPTPASYFQCDCYVQPKRSMLLEYVRKTELTTYFNADGVFFQDENAFNNFDSVVMSTCKRCFMGDD